MHTNDTFETFYQLCSQLAADIETSAPALIDLLSHYETHEAAEDEIMRSVEALRGVNAEFAVIDKPLSDMQIATFFPLNLPLYSLILFGIIPSVFCRDVFIRPPEIMNEVLDKLWTELDISGRFPVVSLKPTPRHVFVQLYASEADAIIFTGKYENAVAIHKACPMALMIYNGSGINPFIIFENADVELAVEKAIEMRLFNSGQDCAGPDAFFVHTSLTDEFTKLLSKRLSDVKVGDTTDPAVNVGRTMKQAYIDEIDSFLRQEKDHVVFGGHIDYKNHFVYPTIIRKSVSRHHGQFHEFFAPCFYVLEFNDATELDPIIRSSDFQSKGMYVSAFGDNDYTEQQLTFVRVLKNQIVNDVERGNEAYGGYGDKANFLLLNDQKLVQPVLISRDMHTVLVDE